MKNAFGFLLSLIAAGLVISFAMDDEPTARGQESGSTERPGPRIRFPFVPNPQESGSRERFDPRFPFPFDPQRIESGSFEKPGGLVPLGPQSPDADNTKTADSPVPATQPGTSPPRPGTPADYGASTFITTQAPDLIAPVLILLVGLFLVGWSLFRLGVMNPYASTLWPKRLELCIEIALRMDDFMTAYREENFSKCQMSLDALNHLNGRRSILLSNEINAAVNKFVELAVSAKVSLQDEAYQKEFNRQYERVIESLRVGTRQEELTLEVLQSLTKAQGSHRRIKDSASS